MGIISKSPYREQPLADIQRQHLHQITSSNPHRTSILPERPDEQQRVIVSEIVRYVCVIVWCAAIIDIHYMHTYSYICACTYTYIYTHIHSCTLTHTLTYTYKYTHMHIHSHTLTLTYTYTHIRIHIRMQRTNMATLCWWRPSNKKNKTCY